MKKDLSLFRFVVMYGLYAALIAGIAILLPILFPNTKLLSDRFWLLFGFLSGLTLIAYVLAAIGIKRSPEVGVMAIMGSIILKMLFAMGFLLIYSRYHKENGLVFSLNFFSLYLLFTFFEIYGLLRNLRHQNK